jgi:hypothetical protein
VSLAATEPLQHVRRQLRLIAILAAAETAGLTPLPARQLHTVGYFADALAPVWGLRILDAQLLKRAEGPTSQILQHDVDRLVGRGILTVSSVGYSEDADGLWRLDADYSLNLELAQPIIDAARPFASFALELEYLREVVFAMSGLGVLGIGAASAADASYGNRLIEFGDVVDIESRSSEPNQSARVAIRFGELMAPEIALSDAEKVHLYVRELYVRLQAND